MNTHYILRIPGAQHGYSEHNVVGPLPSIGSRVEMPDSSTFRVTDDIRLFKNATVEMPRSLSPKS